MKNLLGSCITLAVLLCLARETLTSEAVLKLVKAGVSEEAIANEALTSPSLGADASPVTEIWTAGPGGAAANTPVQAPARVGTQIGGITVDRVSSTTTGRADPASSMQIQLNARASLMGNDTRVFQGAVCYGTTAGTGFTVLPNNYGTPSCNADQNPTLHFIAGSQNNALQHWPLPKTWSGTVDAQIKWRTSGTSGNVTWGIQTIAVPDGEVLAQTLGTASTVTTAAPAVALAPKTETLTGITIANASLGLDSAIPGICSPTPPAPVYLATNTLHWYWCSATNTWSPTTGVELVFQLYRLGTGSDTLNADAELEWLAMRFNIRGALQY